MTRIIDLITRLAPRFAHLYPVAYLLVVCLALAALASYIDVGAVFGAMIAGMLFGTLPQREFQEARETITSFAMSFFVPIYFAMVGLQISFRGNIDLLLHAGIPRVIQRGGHPDGLADDADRRSLGDGRLELLAWR